MHRSKEKITLMRTVEYILKSLNYIFINKLITVP